MTHEEMMDSICKFKVGDVVYPLIHRIFTDKKGKHLKTTPLQVIERVVQQCYGGIQVAYVVRVHLPGEWSTPCSFSTEFQRLLEIELTSEVPVHEEAA
jgi:hypothetical protein